MIRNGVVFDTYDIGGGQGEVTDFDGPVDLMPEDGADSWFVLLAQSEERAQVVYPGERIFAFSNPIFIDADSDEVFTPPPYRPMDENTTPFCR